MKFAFVAKHRAIWPVAWACKALDVSTSGFHDWLHRKPAKRTLENEAVLDLVRRSFLESDRTYGARRVWKDVLAEGLSCGLHRIERLMHKNERFKGFTSDHGIKLLVWQEHHHNMEDAIRREKQLKKWNRDWKIRLIEGKNPDWLDLHDDIDTIASLVEPKKAGFPPCAGMTG